MITIVMDFRRRLWCLVCDGEPLVLFRTYREARRVMQEVA